jgi:DNA-binding NarL/FixJ family response regulator
MTQADWEIAGRTIYAWSVRDVLSSLRSPALILQPRDYVTVRPEEAMKLAAQIRGARMVLIKGDSMLGDAGEGIAALESFLAGLPAGAASPPAKPLNADSASPGGLSSREVEVLRLLAAGKSNAQIAADLVISQNTVIRHVSNIFAKTGAANRAAAGDYAHRHGIV